MVHTEQPTTHHLSPAQTARRILRATGALMLVQVILRGFGLIEKMILAKFFGTDFRADAYNAARDIAMYLFQLGDQVIMHSFLPVFVARMREHGEKDAWRLASTTLNIIILLTAVLAVLGIFFAPEVLPWFVPDWFKGSEARDPGLIPLTITLVKIMLVASIFLTASSLTYCLLNSYKQFALPASADMVLKGSVLVFAILFIGNLTWGPLALAAGFVCGAVGKIAVHTFGLGRRFLNYRPVVDVRHPGLGRFGWLALPLIIGVLFSIFRQVMDTRFTSTLAEGSLSALKYARTLCDMPVQFFPYVFGIALFPFLADIAVAGDKDRLRGMLMSATRMMLLIFVPLALALIIMRYPIINGLFGSDKFGEASAHLTAGPLQIYAAGMLIGALEIIVLQFFFAMSDTLRPIVVGMILSPLHIGFSYLGVFHWELGVLGVAAALVVYKTTKVAVLYFMMRRKLHSLEGRKTLVLLGKVAVALAPFILLLLAGTYLLPMPGNVEGKAAKLLALLPFVATGGVAMLVYLGVLHYLRVDEVNMLVQRIRGKLGKKDAAPETAEQAGVE
ncbi:MAG: murein biosynthesis integral membrane protein MurJ [Armatimonadota bacterium]